MLFRIIFSLVISSLLLTACGGGSKAKKKLSCTETSDGDLVANCKTETVDLKDGADSLVITDGTRTEKLELNCNGKTVKATTTANYLTGKIDISAEGESTVACDMTFTSPLDATLISNKDVMDLVEWGEDPQDPSYEGSNIPCPDDVLNEDPAGDIPPEMVAQCTGYIQADYDFTDNTNKHHKFTIKYTIK